MVRKNEDEALIELKIKLEEWHLSEFGYPVDPVAVDLEIKAMEAREREKFLFRRLGHLSPEDLGVFRSIWNGERKAKEPTSEETEVADSTGVAGQSQESPKDAGKRVRRGPNKHGQRHSGDGGSENN